MGLAFSATLWCTPRDSWHFVTLPEDLSDQIRLEAGPPTGLGAVRVEATIGASTWRTSLFPTPGGAYVLPVKAPVRRAEHLEDGDETRVVIELVPR